MMKLRQIENYIYKISAFNCNPFRLNVMIKTRLRKPAFQ